MNYPGAVPAMPMPQGENPCTVHVTVRRRQYRGADALMPTTTKARRWLRPRSVMLSTSTRRAGAVTTFGAGPRA